MKGLFQAASLIRPQTFSESSQCGKCGLFKSCKSPKMSPQGSGSSGILIVVPEVTQSGDEHKNFLYSTLGSHIKRLLAGQGLTTKDCWITAATICRGKDVTDEQVDACSFKLRETIRELKPRLIIAIGRNSIRNIIQFTWNRAAENTDKWYGYQIPSQIHNAWVCPVIEPYESSQPNCSLLLFQKQFLLALEKKKPPFTTVPDYRKQVHIVTAKEAARFVKHVTKKGGVAAWDIETNCLKPEHKPARIVSVSVCWRGTHTIAAPWHGTLPEAFCAFLHSPKVWKIASNLQFEHRWAKAILNVRVRNWIWDTMQAAHAIDNRKGAASIKFQSFVRLGIPSYDNEISQFLRSGDEKVEDAHALNLIHEIELNDLLLYNGLDSLLEYLVAVQQAKEMGHPAYKAMK